jgi:hypothetical protein
MLSVGVRLCGNAGLDMRKVPNKSQGLLSQLYTAKPHLWSGWAEADIKRVWRRLKDTHNATMQREGAGAATASSLAPEAPQLQEGVQQQPPPPAISREDAQQALQKHQRKVHNATDQAFAAVDNVFALDPTLDVLLVIQCSRTGKVVANGRGPTLSYDAAYVHARDAAVSAIKAGAAQASTSGLVPNLTRSHKAKVQGKAGPFIVWAHDAAVKEANMAAWRATLQGQARPDLNSGDYLTFASTVWKKLSSSDQAVAYQRAVAAKQAVAGNPLAIVLNRKAC